jgi:hypothetical protein
MAGNYLAVFLQIRGGLRGTVDLTNVLTCQGCRLARTELSTKLSTSLGLMKKNLFNDNDIVAVSSPASEFRRKSDDLLRPPVVGYCLNNNKNAVAT